MQHPFKANRKGNPLSKIAAVKAYPIVAKLKNVQRTAQESRADVELLLVEVITDDGVKGYGQVTSTPMPDPDASSLAR